MIDPLARAAGAEAMSRLDKLLETRPHETHEEVTQAVRGIVRIRDALIELRRAGADTPGLQDTLAQANRLVSTAIGAQFPITGMHWERVEKTRDGLRALLGAL